MLRQINFTVYVTTLIFKRNLLWIYNFILKTGTTMPQKGEKNLSYKIPTTLLLGSQMTKVDWIVIFLSILLRWDGFCFGAHYSCVTHILRVKRGAINTVPLETKTVKYERDPIFGNWLRNALEIWFSGRGFIAPGEYGS